MLALTSVSVLVLLACGASPVEPAAQALLITRAQVVPVNKTALDIASFSKQVQPDDQEDDCRDQVGYVENGVLNITMREYDILEILKATGGAPGKVNVTRSESKEEHPVLDPEERPLPDNNRTYHIYTYRATDLESYYREEHALLRFPGSKREFTDVRGEIWWQPPDFCKHFRRAEYRLDDKGFHADLSTWICDMDKDKEYMTCLTPVECKMDENKKIVYCLGGWRPVEIPS